MQLLHKTTGISRYLSLNLSLGADDMTGVSLTLPGVRVLGEASWRIERGVAFVFGSLELASHGRWMASCVRCSEDLQMSISWYVTCRFYFPGAMCSVCCVNINDLLLLRKKGQMMIRWVVGGFDRPRMELTWDGKPLPASHVSWFVSGQCNAWKENGCTAFCSVSILLC